MRRSVKLYLSKLKIIFLCTFIQHREKERRKREEELKKREEERRKRHAEKEQKERQAVLEKELAEMEQQLNINAYVSEFFVFMKHIFHSFSHRRPPKEKDEKKDKNDSFESADPKSEDGTVDQKDPHNNKETKNTLDTDKDPGIDLDFALDYEADAAHSDNEPEAKTDKPAEDSADKEGGQNRRAGSESSVSSGQGSSFQWYIDVDSL